MYTTKSKTTFANIQHLQSPYTYIPNDPRSYFRLLMNMCMDLDTNIAPDTERAKSSVLSQASEDLLRECWKTWRLSPPFRAVLYLELIKNRLDTDESQGEVDIDEASDAMRALDKCLKENEIRNWTINDVRIRKKLFVCRYLANVC